MKNNDDTHVCKEDPAKKGESNPEFIKKNHLLEKNRPADWFNDLLANKLTRGHNHGPNMWASYTSMKGFLSNLGYNGRLCQGFKALLTVGMIAFI